MHNSQNRGFTLIEVLIAAGILACSLVGVAALFSYAIRANTHNRQMAAATALACDKMEELRALPFNSSLWTPGSETIVVNSGRFTRSWQFSPDVPRAVTVVIYANTGAMSRRQTELIRVTTLIGPVF